MKSYRITPKAKDDLFDIWSYVAADDLEAADRLEAQLVGAFERIASQPDLGHFRRDLTDKPVGFFLVESNYLIVYDAAAQPVEIVRVLHGARDATSEMGE